MSLSAQDVSGAEEIIVSVEVRGVGGTEMPAIINNERLYLPATDLFNFLRIKNTVSEGLDSVYGFFLKEEAIFVIDKKSNTIRQEGKLYNLRPDDIIVNETGLYLDIALYDTAFSLHCKFNFRSLLVQITTELELPVIREARLDFMRKNVDKLKGDIKVDTVLPRRFPMFSFGTADWSVISNQEIGGLGASRFSLGLGAIVARGELNAVLNHSPEQEFSNKRQFYLWRFVNNEHKAVRQVNIGKLATNAHSSIFAPIVGVQVSNAPTTMRKSFGTFTISDAAPPDWIAELYVNNVLVAYQKVDVSGRYTFAVPLVYGNSIVLVKLYGPFGEQRFSQQVVNVPFNFLPAREFEYSVAGGVVEDDSTSRFGRAATGYGLTNNFTVGAGVEYLTSVTSGPVMPYVNGSYRLGKGLMLSGEHIYSVRSRGNLSYRLPSNLQIDLRYTKYTPGQLSVNTLSLEERRISLALPFKAKRFTMFSLINFTDNILATTRFDNLEWLLSGMYNHVGIRLNSYGIFIKDVAPYFYSDLSLIFRLPYGYTFTPQVQYEYTQGELISAKAIIEKRVWTKGFLNVQLEENFKTLFRSATVQFRYEFSFAQLATSVRATNRGLYLLEAANGSLYYNNKTRRTGTTSGTMVGRGGAVIVPFLDMNGDGNKQKDEPRVSGLKFTINAGTILREDKDSTIRIIGLEPYTNCFIEFNRFSFDNITWIMKNNSLRFTVEPNRIKPIEVPIAVMGEVNGMVYIQKNGVPKGQGQVYVCIYNDTGMQVARILSEPDGFFSYIGLKPGKYTAALDTAQMGKINATASEPEHFNVRSTRDGDVVEGLEFTIYPATRTGRKDEKGGGDD